MENKKKKQWLLAGLLLLVSVASFCGWYAIGQIIDTSQINNSWLAAIIWFSLSISIMCLIALSFQKTIFSLGSIVLLFVPSVLFIQNWMFLFFVCISMALCFMGLSRMRRAMALHITIHIRRSMHYGTGWIVLSLALAITSFYYVQIRNESGDKLLQMLSLDQASHALLNRILGFVNPEFKKANQENVSVDEFLMTFQKNQTMNDIAMTTPSDVELLKMAGLTPSDPRSPQALIQIKKGIEKNTQTINPQKIILDQSRKQLSDTVGTPLLGQESITDVLSQIIDQRIRTYFKPNETSNSASILPFILSIILFVTLWSLGAVLMIAWRFMTAGLFALLCKFGVIDVQKVMIEQEMIV